MSWLSNLLPRNPRRTARTHRRLGLECLEGRLAPAALGTLDPSFGKQGVVLTDIFGPGDTPVVGGVALQKDGKAVVAGYAYDHGNQDIVLMRYDVRGRLDPSFGNGGVVTLDLSGSAMSSGSSDAQANAVAIQADGKIVIAGSFTPSGGSTQLLVARFSSDGRLDRNFDADGLATIGSSDLVNANAVALQGDGKIVVAGGASDTDFGVARFNANGSVDQTFGNSGVVTTFLNDAGANATGVVLQPDGKIVVAGYAGEGIAVVRYTSRGALDRGFGGDGIVDTFLPYSSAAYGVALQGDGKIVVAGDSYDSNQVRSFVVVRYTVFGGLDTDFNGSGYVLTRPGDPVTGPSDSSNDFTEARAVAIQPDGKILAAGFVYQNASNDIALVRYQPDGTLDSHFGDGGVSVTDLGRFDSANGMALQSDGQIVLAGQSIDSSTSQDYFATLRYVGYVNHPPVAHNDSALVKENGRVTIDVLRNDTTAPDTGETLTPHLRTRALHGSVTLIGKRFRYTPAHNYHGTDRFVYTIDDGHGGTATATVTITVQA